MKEGGIPDLGSCSLFPGQWSLLELVRGYWWHKLLTLPKHLQGLSLLHEDVVDPYPCYRDSMAPSEDSSSMSMSSEVVPVDANRKVLTGGTTEKSSADF